MSTCSKQIVVVQSGLSNQFGICHENAVMLSGAREAMIARSITSLFLVSSLVGAKHGNVIDQINGRRDAKTNIFSPSDPMIQ
jgi:hypothetical protein